jgi:hypothetical protein
VCGEVTILCRVNVQYIRVFLCVLNAGSDYRGRRATLIKCIVANAGGATERTPKDCVK